MPPPVISLPAERGIRFTGSGDMVTPTHRAVHSDAIGQSIADCHTKYVRHYISNGIQEMIHGPLVLLFRPERVPVEGRLVDYPSDKDQRRTDYSKFFRQIRVGAGMPRVHAIFPGIGR